MPPVQGLGSPDAADDLGERRTSSRGAWRAAAAAASLGLGVVGLVHGWAPLSTVLVMLPLLAVLLLRPADLRTRWRKCITVAWLLVAALVPTLVSLPLALSYGAAPVWWSSLLRGWVFSGLVGIVLVVGWRCWPVGSAHWRLFPAALLHGLLVLGAPPLGALFVQQLTSADAPAVCALSRREEIILRMDDGISLAARWYAPVAVPARGVVVFTHGFGGWKEGFLNHLRLFLADGWAVLAYDLRGHGQSSPALVSYGAREADDLVAVWREARRRAGELPLAAYGVSLGSAVTLLAAERLPGCRLLMVESPFPDVGALMHERLAAPILPVALMVTRIGAGFDPQSLVPAQARLPEPGTRVVVAWSRTDQVIPAEASRAVAAAFPGAVTCEMPQGAHLDVIIHQPYRDLISGILATIR